MTNTSRQRGVRPIPPPWICHCTLLWLLSCCLSFRLSRSLVTPAVSPTAELLVMRGCKSVCCRPLKWPVVTVTCAQVTGHCEHVSLDPRDLSDDVRNSRNRCTTNCCCPSDYGGSLSNRTFACRKTSCRELAVHFRSAVSSSSECAWSTAILACVGQQQLLAPMFLTQNVGCNRLWLL